MGKTNAQPSPLFSSLCFGNIFFLDGGKEEGREVIVMCGEGEREAVTDPPVAAPSLLDTVFRSEALGKGEASCKSNDGGLGHFY